MARKEKARRHLKRRGATAAATRRDSAGLISPTDGPPGDESPAGWPTALPDADRAEIERADEPSPESIDSLTEPAADDSSTSAIEAAADDPAQAQAPPYLVER